MDAIKLNPGEIRKDDQMWLSYLAYLEDLGALVLFVMIWTIACLRVSVLIYRNVSMLVSIKKL